MADDLTPPAEKPRAERPGIENADVPSDTVGLPGVGDGASARHFARDVVEEGQRGEGDDEAEPHAPSDPRDPAG